ncbi:hypothetical protein NLJ89_g4882 [Agrocybe chaxingu]|uniref:Uncharacterized protein n=1 Tax=Agrocybe chaxingu TaxID=84603 RepID=A0A9W8K281_9AGAR|nr:hypothetical protein NLJ89_g4882 [Agrocybe chaxingu]
MHGCPSYPLPVRVADSVGTLRRGVAAANAAGIALQTTSNRVGHAAADTHYIFAMSSNDVERNTTPYLVEVQPVTSSGTSSSSSPEERRRRRSRFQFSLPTDLHDALQCFTTLGTSVYCQQHLRHEVDFRDRREGRWKERIDELSELYTFSAALSAIDLGVCIALLQISPVLNNAFPRTCAFSAIIFSAHGLISSGIYIGLRHRLLLSRVEGLWKDASTTPMDPDSSKFWISIATPMAYTAWSYLWFMLAIIRLAWSPAHQDNEIQTQNSDASAYVNGIWVSLLVLFSIFQLWRAIRLLLFPKGT